MLGPVRVLDDSGVEVTPVAAKQVLLLTVLLCHRDEAVPADRLADLLWDDAPVSARANLQVYVHRLRHRLGPDRIVLGPAGYRLRVAAAEADDTRFAHAIVAGHRQLGAGDARAAHDTLSAALDLWRGVPYAGHEDVEPVRVQVARLSELRLVALADRLRADLALGRHGAAVGELAALVAEHPLREELRGLLMLALHRSGRSAEALQTYRDARRTAVDELGLEPGADLRDLHQTILADTDAPATPAAASGTSGAPSGVASASSSPGVVAPSQLPAAESSFVGRDTQLHELVDRLRDRPGPDTPAVVAISGLGGVGKSALARQAANMVADTFPDGQLYLNLQGSTPGAEPLPPRDALSRLLRSLRVPDLDIPATTDEAAALFRSVTADRHLLIVLDNAADTAQVRPLLPGRSSGSAVLITSRAVLGTLDVASHLRLDALTDTDAVALLGRLAGAGRVHAEPDAATEIAHMCDRLPLALRIAGARLLARPDWALTTLRDRLHHSTARLDELEHGDLAVRASCAVGYLALPKDTAHTFTTLGALHLPDATAPVIAALTAQPVTTTTTQLDRLVEARLLDTTAPDRYVLHDLLRLYAQERATETLTPAERRTARLRVVHHQLATARAAMLVLAPGRPWRLETGTPADEVTEAPLDLADSGAAGAWVRAEATALVTSVRYAATLPDHGPALVTGLSAVLVQLFHTQTLWAELDTVTTIALDAAARAGHPAWTATAHHDVGIAAAIHGRLDDAETHLQTALHIYEDLADPRGQALVADSFGNMCCLAGRYADGVRYHRRALANYLDAGDDPLAARTRGNLAWSLYLQGDHAAAVDAYQDALRAFQANGDEIGRAGVLLNLSQLHLDQERPADALTTAGQAAEIYVRSGHMRRHVMALWRLATAQHRLGDVDAARAGWRHALELLRESGALTDDTIDEIMAAPVPEPPSVLRET